MRDIVLEETVFFDFTTRAFATGIPTVLAGTPVLSVLEENNATPITDGVSVSVDRASVVGLNMATIVATDANGYEAGKGYSVYISTGTVSSVSVVGEIVAQFTIGASAAAQDLANGTDGLTALKTGIDDIPTVAEFNARTLLSANYFDFTTDQVILLTATQASIDAIETDTSTTLPAAIAANATPAEVNLEMLDVMTIDTFAEPGSVPAATSSLADKIGWPFTMTRNKLLQTATLSTLRNDADNGDIATSIVSDDTSTFTRSEWT